MSNEYIGKVVWFNNTKGYGFVKVDPVFVDYGNKDIFFHWRGIKKISGKRPNLEKEDDVVFNIKSGEKAVAMNLSYITSQ